MKLIAHRGCSYENFNQNSIRAFKKVIDEGCEAFEFDVQKTADDHLVVVHNLELDNVSSGSGLVSQKTLKYIRAIDAGSAKNGKDKIPLLHEVLDLAKNEKNVVLHLELKGKNTALPSAKLIQKYLKNGDLQKSHFLVSSFDFNELHIIKQEIPDIPIALLSGSILKDELMQKVKYDKELFKELFAYSQENFMLPKFTSLKQYEQLLNTADKAPLLDAIKENLNGSLYDEKLLLHAKKMGAFSINVWHKNIHRKFIQKAHEHGFKIFAYTVNEKEDILRMKDFKVDGIFTDFFARSREILQKLD